MSPKNIQVIQSELAIVWDDGSESYISLEKLRRYCPCAVCAGEQDVLGREYRAPPTPYKPESFELRNFQPVGGYAINFQWGDGHGSGLYPFPLLKKLGEIQG
jgi:DUF971 family protein